MSAGIVYKQSLLHYCKQSDIFSLKKCVICYKYYKYNLLYSILNAEKKKSAEEKIVNIYSK